MALHAQFSLPLATFADHHSLGISQCDIADALSCHVGSISNQIFGIHVVDLPIGMPRFLCPNTLKMTANIVTQSFKQKTPMTIGELPEHIGCFVGVTVSASAVSHIL
jgi:hypothetical protein